MMKTKKIFTTGIALAAAVLMASTAFAFQQGDTGDDVKVLQELLIKQHYLGGEADGSYGPMTVNAVKSLESEFGLDIDGIAGAEEEDLLKLTDEGLAYEKRADEEGEVTMFRTVEIVKYEDGKYFVEPNTVSQNTITDAWNVLNSIEKAFKESEEVPKKDTVKVLSADPESFPEGVALPTLDALKAKAAELGEDITITDTSGNEVIFKADGTGISESGKIALQEVDYDTKEAVGDPEEISLEELAPEDGAPVPAYTFRTIAVLKNEDGSYSVEPGTVSEKTLEEARKAYAAMRFAYVTSTDIPLDLEDLVEVDPNNLPDYVSTDSVILDETTGRYYIPKSVAAGGAEEVIQPTTVYNDGGAAPAQPSQGSTPQTEPQSNNVPSQNNTPAPAPAPTPAPAPAEQPTQAPAHQHSYSSSVTQAATCSQPGVITYTCSCGDSYTEAIPTTAHNFVTQSLIGIPHFKTIWYCNGCDATFDSSDGIHQHLSESGHGSWGVDDIIDYWEELGWDAGDGNVIGYRTICTTCGYVAEEVRY